jgi:dTDP-4-amino-4,6-dideoxygalactose transaminase
VRKGDLENTERIAKSVITLPLYPQMTKVEQNEVIDALQKILQ